MRYLPLKSAGLLLLLVLPAAFLWRNRDIPQFGDLHDDGLYYVSAQSLAQGHYRIESLPGKPAQTKYPPLYPLLLSLAWRVQPRFPQNLPIAACISWAALPLMLILLSVYYPRMGISGWRMWVLLALLATNSYIVLFSARLLSEVWFTALLIGALLLAERAVQDRGSPGWAIAAGLVGGLAYLVRSAGIVLLASGVVYFWIRGQRRKAVFFAAGMLPFVAGWMLWSRLNQLPTTDPALIYYLDYVKYEFFNVHLSNLHLVLWKNLDGLLWGLGSMVLPKVVDSLFLKIIAELLAVAMISGVFRMVFTNSAQAGRGVHYALFAAGSALMLVIWHFPTNERFVLPLVPLAFAGLLTEMEHFAGMVRAGRQHKDASQRAAANVMAAMVAVGLAACLALQAYVGIVLLDQVNQQQRVKNSDSRAAYDWIRTNLPAGSAVLAYEDPVLFLYTGHASIRRPIPPQIWYEEDHQRAAGLYRDFAEYARQHGAGYVYYTTADDRRDLSDEDAATRDRIMNSNPDLIPIREIGIGTIYRVRPIAAYTSAPSSTIARPGQVVSGR